MTNLLIFFRFSKLFLPIQQRLLLNEVFGSTLLHHKAISD
jgi:hypothetical protein